MDAPEHDAPAGSSADLYGDVPLRQLDEDLHQEELRQRYYGLLQELRVVLPGVQVLVAFLLTTPFAGRFLEVDETGRVLYGVALWTGLMAVVCFVSPTIFHRVGGRTLRAERLLWGIRAIRARVLFLAAALLSASLVVTRFVYEGWAAALFVSTIALGMLVAWVAIPLWSTHTTRRRRVVRPPIPDPGPDGLGDPPAGAAR
jgi:hypothetical protein